LARYFLSSPLAQPTRVTAASSTCTFALYNRLTIELYGGSQFTASSMCIHSRLIIVQGDRTLWRHSIARNFRFVLVSTFTRVYFVIVRRSYFMAAQHRSVISRFVHVGTFTWVPSRDRNHMDLKIVRRSNFMRGTPDTIDRNSRFVHVRTFTRYRKQNPCSQCPASSRCVP